jgi:tetratricopeptide (TPR) repeat protein
LIKSVINKILIVLILLVSLNSIVLGQQKKQSTSRLAYEYYNGQEWDKAASLFLQMYQENGVKQYLNNYIRCLVQLKDYKTAEQTLSKTIRKTKDQSLYIDLAYLSELQGNEKKSGEMYLRPMKNFPQTVQSIKTLGNNYLYYLKYEYAQQVYEIGRQILNQPDEFHLEMAGIFHMQRNYPKMLDEYFELLIYQPRYLRTVQAQLRNAISRDIDETLLASTKTKTLAQIQTYPGLDVFNEMLIWIYLQEEDFDSAIELAAALDRRNKENGDRLLELARTADNAKVHNSAIKAYDIIIAKGPPSVNNKTSRNIATVQSPFRLAKQEILTAELSLLESKNNSQQADYLNLAKNYEKTIEEVGLDHLNVTLLKELSYIYAYRLENLNAAVDIIDSALQTPRIPKALRAEMILDKADIYLIQDDPWEATFLYAQVEKENKQNPIGSLAKYKKAMLAYYTGNFDWAKMQLDVLKGSTSKLIANDAFELSLLIRENQNFEDSLNNGLLLLSKADYLYFQKKTDSALLVLNSLIVDLQNHPIADDALFREAEIYLDTNREEEALMVLEKIYSDYLDDIWGHKALFFLGKIYEERNDKEKALDYYQQLLDKFPNSFYHIDSRNKIREIKNNDLSTDENP